MLEMMGVYPLEMQQGWWSVSGNNAAKQVLDTDREQ